MWRIPVPGNVVCVSNCHCTVDMYNNIIVGCGMRDIAVYTVYADLKVFVLFFQANELSQGIVGMCILYRMLLLLHI